ncbi:hypothetical protein ACFQ06_16630, partial [Tessaracoccus lubricantis]
SEVAGVTMVSGEVADVGRAAAPRMPQEPEHIDGFVADPAQLHGLGERWTGLAGQVAAVPRHPESGMGLFEAAQRSQLTLSQQIDAWRTGAVDEFEGIAERLHETAAQYEGVDDAGIAELRRTEGLRA